MAEYIEKEAPVQFLLASAEGLHDTPSWKSLLEECAEKINRIPAANVRENVKAKWLEDSDPGELIGSHWACSECNICFGEPTAREIFKFCPNCGAQMGGAE